MLATVLFSLGALSLLGPAGALSTTCGRAVCLAPDVQDQGVFCDFSTTARLFAWRDNRHLNGGQTYLTLLDSLGQPASGWPADGVLLHPDGRTSIQIRVAKLAAEAAVVAWSDQTGGPEGREVFWAAIRGAPGGLPQPGDLVIDSVTAARPGAQVLVDLVRQDAAHSLAVMNDGAAPGRILIKQLSLPGEAPGPWPAGGVVLADESGTFPAGIAAAAACADDSGGCYVLQGGTIPIDPFHFTVSLRLAHLLPDGLQDPRWPSGGMAITEDGDEFNLNNPVVADGAGGAFVAWTTGNHSVDGRVRVMLQHVDRAGGLHPGWSASGLPAIPAASPQYQSWPRLAVGPGGRLAVLLSSDDTFRVLRLLETAGTSSPGWPDTGVVIGHDPAQRLFDPTSGRVAFAVDSAIVVAWSESRADTANNLDVYGLLLDMHGNVAPGWPAVGVSLCPGPGNDGVEQLVALDPRGLELLWIDGPEADQRHGMFAFQDGATPGRPQARLLSHGLRGRSLSARWAGHDVTGRQLIALASINGGPTERRGTVVQFGASTIAQSDTLPADASRASYVIAIDDGAPEVISDTLWVAATESRVALSVATALVQTGPVLTAVLEVDQAIEGVEVRLLDIGGRVAWFRRLGRLQPGVARVEIPVGRLTPGVMFLSATGGGVRATAKTVIVR